MLDLPWTIDQSLSSPTARQRVLVLVDRASADARLLAKIAPESESPPAAIVWLWVVMPGAVVSWGALLAESGDRTRILLSALNECLEEARRYMTPLQRACHVAELACQSHILHGAVVESVVRLASGEAVEQVLLAASGGSLYGQSAQELAATLAQRLRVPVSILEGTTTM